MNYRSAIDTRQTISVLIPVRNAQSTVKSAVESMLRQTYGNFEVVVIDDGSTDATPHILDEMASRDTRLRIEHTPPRGIISALNTGVDLCRGDLIARMDADDISHPQRLALQAEYMRTHPEISVCSSRVRIFPRQNLLGGLVRYEQWLNSIVDSKQIARDFFVESPVAHPSVLIRKDDLIQVGGYEEHGWPEDYDLWLRFHTAGKLFGKIDRTLTFWRQSESRLTFTDSRYSLENFLRAKAHYLARMLQNRDRPIILWGAGKTGRRLLKHLLREGLSIESIIDIDPKKISNTMRGIPIVAPNYLHTRPTAFIITAVGSHAARNLIRQSLNEMNFTELQDFICAA